MTSLWSSRQFRRYLAAATVALASAAIAVGPTQGAPRSAPGAAVAVVPAIQHPVFRNGMAVPVFTELPAAYVEQELWVTSSTDSDHDGKKDVIHIDVTRVEETEHG
ncbi:MAG: hypothetical protein M3O94_02215, partial [Actinomycetota bacterium]|nr:hypothetical protein [Actinomycetota bacterium]